MDAVTKNKIQIKTSAEVVDVKKEDRFSLILKNGEVIQADFVVIAMGGNSKSTHYEILKKIGHQLVDPIPSLFTFNLPKHESNQLMGLSYDVSVRLKNTAFEEYGPLLFTHWGMSGPAILKLSAKAAKWLYDRSYQFEFEVSWLEDGGEFIQFNRSNFPSQKLQQKKPDKMPNGQT